MKERTGKENDGKRRLVKERSARGKERNGNMRGKERIVTERKAGKQRGAKERKGRERLVKERRAHGKERKGTEMN